MVVLYRISLARLDEARSPVLQDTFRNELGYYWQCSESSDRKEGNVVRGFHPRLRTPCFHRYMRRCFGEAISE